MCMSIVTCGLFQAIRDSVPNTPHDRVLEITLLGLPFYNAPDHVDNFFLAEGAIDTEVTLL